MFLVQNTSKRGTIGLNHPIFIVNHDLAGLLAVLMILKLCVRDLLNQWVAFEL
jgi:hypothetical protein